MTSRNGSNVVFAIVGVGTGNIFSQLSIIPFTKYTEWLSSEIKTDPVCVKMRWPQKTEIPTEIWYSKFITTKIPTWRKECKRATKKTWLPLSEAEFNSKLAECLIWSNHKTMRTLVRKSPVQLLREKLSANAESWSTLEWSEAERKRTSTPIIPYLSKFPFWGHIYWQRRKNFIFFQKYWTNHRNCAIINMIIYLWGDKNGLYRPF